MRIALVNATKKEKIPNVGLLKIGSYLKANGHECELFSNEIPIGFDEIWISVIFTYDIYHALKLTQCVKDKSKIKFGGPAVTVLPEYFKDYDVHSGLLNEAENYPPDYTLLKNKIDYSISMTSRGCIRNCKFCIVPKIEPTFESRDWIKDIQPTTKKIVFFDNNWFAKKNIHDDIEILMNLKKEKRLSNIDFNQGLDCRLVTEDLVKSIKDLPIWPIRFAFDGKQEYGHFENAIRLFVKYGFHHFCNSLLYNFTDTPSEFYYRLRTSIELFMETRKTVASMPMRYQPITVIDRKYVGKYWSLERLRAFRLMVSSNCLGIIHFAGTKKMTPLEEFEFFYGKDAKEFEDLLDYPEIKKLCGRKKGYMHFHKAKYAKSYKGLI